MPSPSLLQSDLARRIAITLAVLAVFRALSWVPLPGIDLATATSLGSTPLLAMTVERLSLGALGVVPWLTALAVAGLAAIAWPPFEAWIEARPANRANFNRGIVIAALFLAGLQAGGIAAALEDIPRLVPNPGVAFRLGLSVSLVGGTAAVIWLGFLINRYGIGGGFWILLAVPHALSIADAAIGGGIPLFDFVLLAVFFAFCVAVLATVQPRTRVVAEASEPLWAIMLGNVAASWLLMLGMFALWVASPNYGAEINERFSGLSGLLLAAVAVPVVAVLRRRSAARASGERLDVSKAALFALSLGVLAAGAALLQLFYIPDAYSALVLAATGLLIAANLRALNAASSGEDSPSAA